MVAGSRSGWAEAGRREASRQAHGTPQSRPSADSRPPSASNPKPCPNHPQQQQLEKRQEAAEAEDEKDEEKRKKKRENRRGGKAYRHHIFLSDCALWFKVALLLEVAQGGLTEDKPPGCVCVRAVCLRWWWWCLCVFGRAVDTSRICQRNTAPPQRLKIGATKNADTT